MVFYKKNSSSFIARNKGLLFFIALFCLSTAATAQEDEDYIIGAGDLLDIVFWQKPEFNSQVRVTATGSIELPLIGALPAKGNTTIQLRDKIEGRISLLDVKATQVSVTVKEFGSKTIYITGAVMTPGKFNFEVVPNLWQVILEAGGPTTTAQLDNVAIVRGGKDNAGQIEYVNVAKALENGDISTFPTIYPGDTIHVSAADPEGQGASMPSPLEQRSIVYVWGAVQNPGIFNAHEDMDLLDAIILAGGPTERADMKQVRLFFRESKMAELAIVDMNKYANNSFPIPLTLNSGDAVYIPSKKTALAYMADVMKGVFYIAAGYLVSRI